MNNVIKNQNESGRSCPEMTMRDLVAWIRKAGGEADVLPLPSRMLILRAYGSRVEVSNCDLDQLVSPDFAQVVLKKLGIHGPF